VECLACKSQGIPPLPPLTHCIIVFFILFIYSLAFLLPFFLAAFKRLRQTLIKLRIAYNLTIRSYVSF